MPENEKMDMYQKASQEGIQCYQVMRRDLEQANTPSKPPSKTLKTADIVTRSLERCAEILSSIIDQTYQKFDNKINKSNIKEYSDAIKVHVKALEEINCLMLFIYATLQSHRKYTKLGLNIYRKILTTAFIM